MIHNKHPEHSSWDSPTQHRSPHIPRFPNGMVAQPPGVFPKNRGIYPQKWMVYKGKPWKTLLKWDDFGGILGTPIFASTPHLSNKTGGFKPCQHQICWSPAEWISKKRRLAMTLPEPLKIGHPNRKIVFQPSIFRGYVSFREGNQNDLQCFHIRIWDHDWKHVSNCFQSLRWKRFVVLCIQYSNNQTYVFVSTTFSVARGSMTCTPPPSSQIGPSHPTSSYSGAQSCHSHEATQETNSPPGWNLATSDLVKICEL